MNNESKGNWQAKLSRMRTKAQRNARSKGFDEGFRSGLELNVAIMLKHFGISYEFESDTIRWVSEPQPHKYTPDFKICTASGKIIYIEAKGRFEKEDRDKHLAIRKQHPELDVRFVFSNPHAWDRAARTRSYAKWADANGFIWCSKSSLRKVLQEWVNE